MDPVFMAKELDFRLQARVTRAFKQEVVFLLVDISSNLRYWAVRSTIIISTCKKENTPKMGK